MARVRPVLQVTPSECGLVCAAMLMRSHGRGPTLRELRSTFAPGRDGMTVRQLRDALRHCGFRPAVYRVAPGGAAELPTPFVAHWGRSHYVLVESVSARWVRLTDPASGRRRIRVEDFEQEFSGIAVSAVPTADAPVAAPEPRPWATFLPFVAAHRGRVAALVLSTLATVAVALWAPSVVSAAIAGTDRPSAALVLGVAASYLLTTLVTAALSVSTALAVGRDIADTTFDRLVHLPLRYFAVRARGDLLYRLHSSHELEDLLTSGLARGAAAILLVTVTGIAMLITAPGLAGIALGVFAVLLIGLVLARRWTARWAEHEAHFQSIGSAVQVDTVSTIALVKATGLEDEAARTWRRTNAEILRWTRRSALLDGGVQSVIGFAQSFAPLLLTIAALTGWSGSPVALADAIAFQMLSAVMFGQITTVGQLATKAAHATAAARRLEDILTEPPDDLFHGADGQTVGQHVRGEALSFRYGPLSDTVLDDVTIDAAPGSQIAVVGPSGSGKSTVARLVAGLYRPDAGAVRYGGRDIGDHDRTTFRTEVAYVPQDSPLRNGTVRENIVWGRPGITDDLVQTAARHAQIHTEIVAMPMGYDTVITNAGEALSGGQRQRIALARAFLGDPRVIVLDESTSALDPRTERRIHRWLATSAATRIVISHRLDTVRHSDRIYVLDAGRIVAQGTHHQVLSASALYASLYREQEAPTPSHVAADTLS